MGSFSSLVARALDDPGALDALIFAYESLPAAERLRLVRAVVQDAEQPIPTLAAMLSVEVEPGLRAQLGASLRDIAKGGLAFLSGTATRGVAELVDVGDDGLPRLLRIVWADHEVTELRVATANDLPPLGRATPRETATELVAPMLWRYLRRGGARPAEVERFARCF